MTAGAAALVGLGVLLFLTSAVGLLRFPDFYTRMHAAGKCDTLGALLVLIGLAALQGFGLASVKILLIAVFMFATSPTATHAIARSALRNDLPAWTPEERRPR